MNFEYKIILKNILIIFIINMTMSAVLLDYLAKNNILGYGEVLQGSMTIFGVYLDRTGWILLLSFIMSIVCLLFVVIVVWILYLIWTYIIVKTYKMIFKL